MIDIANHARPEFRVSRRGDHRWRGAKHGGMSGVSGASTGVDHRFREDWETMTSRTRPGRGRWVLLFLLMGLPALFSAMALPLSPANALPWVAVSWPIAGIAGYKIWRIDHPGDSARFAVGIRVRALWTALRENALLFVLAAVPVVVVAGVVLWLLAVSALFLILAIGTGLERVRAARSSTAAAIDQPTIPDAAEPADGELAAALAEESGS